MSENSSDTSGSIQNQRGVEIPGAEHIDIVSCSGCGATIDTSTTASFSKVVCPACGAQTGVPARFDHFTLLKRLGAGGMGTVFLANDDSLGRRVAIKMMQETLGTDPKALEIFRNEAQNAAKLNHPNVAQIYSFGEWYGVPYLEMEFVPGRSLDSMISEEIPLDWAFVMRVGLEVAEGLRAAESVGLFHGDIKPDNILFNEQMSSKLIDFGIASMASQGRSNELWGTPYYIAPEKVQKKRNSARSDIYSLGATLYHAIAGVPPYEGEDAVAVIKARFAGPPVPLVQVKEGIDSEVARIIGRMMYNDLFMRYPNYGSLINDIKNYLSTIPDIRKQGPSARDFARKTSSRISIVTGSLEDDVAAVIPAETGGAGRGGKKFVIQKGAIDAQAAYAAAYGHQNPSASLRPVSVHTGKAVAAEKKQGNPAKVMLIVAVAFFCLLILGAIGGGVMIFTKQARSANKAKAATAQVKEYVDKYFALDEEISSALNKMKQRDNTMMESLASLQKIYRESTGENLRLPDLEPAPGTFDDLRPVDEELEEQDGEEEVITAEALEDAPEGSAEDAPVEMSDEEESDDVIVDEAPLLEEKIPARPSNNLVQTAEDLVYPGARSIREGLRRCEMIYEFQPIAAKEIKADLSLEAILVELENRKQAYKKRTERLDEMKRRVSAADNTLISINRGIQQIEHMGQNLIAERKRIQEENAKAAELARIESEKRKEEAKAKAISDAEVVSVKNVFFEKRELVARFDYDRAIKEMERMERELLTEEGKEELKWTIDRLTRAKAVQSFLLKDISDNGLVRRGYRNYDILEVSRNKGELTIQMQKKIPVEALTLFDWMVLINTLLENRPYDRPIGVVEHGEQLFNASVFVYLHGSEQEEQATVKANHLASLALKKKSSLQIDIKKILPIYEDAKTDDDSVDASGQMW
ncbi:MAG: protein kinase [Lentisphaerae bacterium]|nr:protein kinase [Lentisphaerota bacterium]